MPDGLAVLGQARRQDAGDLLQRGGEARGVFAAPNRVLAQLVELLQEHSRLEVLHAEVAAAREIGPCPLEVPVRAPAVVERASPIDEIVTVAGDSATFARRQVLRVLEAEAPQVADRPALVSPVLREPGLAGVLDDRETVLPGDGHTRIHVAGHPVDAHRHYGAGAPHISTLEGTGLHPRWAVIRA